MDSRQAEVIVAAISRGPATCSTWGIELFCLFPGIQNIGPVPIAGRLGASFAAWPRPGSWGLPFGSRKNLQSGRPGPAAQCPDSVSGGLTWSSPEPARPGRCRKAGRRGPGRARRWRESAAASVVRTSIGAAPHPGLIYTCVQATGDAPASAVDPSDYPFRTRSARALFTLILRSVSRSAIALRISCSIWWDSGCRFDRITREK